MILLVGKFLVVILAFCLMDVVPALITCVILTFLKSLVIEKLMGLDPVSGADFTELTLESEKHRHHLIAYLPMEKFNALKFKEYLYEKGVLKTKKMRQRVINLYGELYWESISFEEAKHQIKIIDDVELKDEEDILKYTAEMYKGPMSQDKPLWEMHLFEKFKDN